MCVLFIFLPHSTPGAAQEEVKKKKKKLKCEKNPQDILKSYKAYKIKLGI